MLSTDLVAYAVYNNGPLQAGILAAGSSYHIGPEAFLLFAGQTTPRVAQDSEFFHGTVYTKYNNGRFFFNAEAAWLYWTDRLSGAGAFCRGAEPAVTLGQVCVPGYRHCSRRIRDTRSSGVLWSNQGYSAGLPR